MPEKKESILDTNEIANKDSASSCSSDFQGSAEEKKDAAATDQHSGKKDGQKNTKIIKRIIKGSKKDKNDPLRFVDGVNFRGKLIGVEDVIDARGDRICQDSLQKLKAIVKSSGEHKQKLLLNISFQGIKITDEKNNELIYHHPVHMISFTSLDVNDNRAFGYIYGTKEDGHKFIGIKSEKAACQVVLILQDLFQAVLEKKKQAMESAKQLQFSNESNDDEEKEIENNNNNNNNNNENMKSEEKLEEKLNSESIYSDVISSSSVETVPPETNKSISSLPKPKSNVDDLLCLQLEVDKLQENIDQMDSSMAAVSELNPPFMPDPFNTSTFVLYPQKDIYESAASTSSSEEQSIGSPLPDSNVNQKSEETSSFYVSYSDNDKYSVFSNIDTISSIFEKPQSSSSTTNQDDEQIVSTDSVSLQANSQAYPSPPKPPRLPQNDLSVFADLDPLGKDRPFLDKKDFFHDIKNPPKKVLKDLVDKTMACFSNEPTTFYTSQSAPETTEVSTCFQSYDATCAPFSCDFNNMSAPQMPSCPSNSLSSSLPNSSKKLSFPLNDNKSSNGNPFTENGIGTVILPPPPPLPPRLVNRSSEPNIRFPPSIKSESTIYSSPTSSGNVPLSCRRGSLPTSQITSEFCQNGTSNNKSISMNLSSSHPIPIPTRKLPVNSQQVGSYNGQNHNSESKKLTRSFEQESPSVDFFGCGFGESLNNSNPNQLSNSVENQEINYSLQKSNKKNQVINKTSLNNSTEKTFILPPPELQLKSNSLSKFKKVNGIVNDNNMTKLSSIPRLPGVMSQYQVLSEICLQNGNMSSCSESTNINSNNSSVSNSGNIFNRKKDPFADDFFAALPKKLNGYQSVPNEL